MVGHNISVQRATYYHKEHKDFHKVVVTVSTFPVVFLQYYFDGQEHLVIPTEPHGNTKGHKTPFIRTKPSFVENIRSSKAKSKQTQINIYDEAGGLLVARNRHQIYK